MGRVYAVVSAKGGVGKTTTTTNLAAALAAAGADVAVVDGDLGMANLAGALGVDSAGPTLHDVLAGEAELDAVTKPGPHGMTVVPGSTDLDAFARADPEGLRDVLSALRADHDYVLLDTGAGLSNDTVVPLTYVDEILLVSTTGRDALGDTEKTRQVAERLDVPVAGAVVTRVDPDSPQNDAVETTLDATVLATIPRADVVRDAGDAGEPLTTYAPGSSAAVAYRALAADLTGESLPGVERAADADAAEPGSTAEATADAEETTTAEADVAEEDDAATEEADADDTREEDIIVAGDHEADGALETVGTVPDEEPADPRADPLADPKKESVSPPPDVEDPLAGVDAAEADSEAGAPADDDVADADPSAAEPADEKPTGTEPTGTEPADDEPLIEAAEPVDDAPDGSDADEETDEEDEDGEEEGVYTTSLVDEVDDEDEDDEKKGLFGRFLG